MLYKYITAYQLIGITPPSDGKEQLLVEYPSGNAKAWITYDLDDHLYESDRASVTGSLMLKKFFGQTDEGDSEAEVIRQLTNFREKRKREVENGVFVVFEAIGEVESFSPRVGREFFDYMVSIGAPEGAVPKKKIKEKYQAKINALLASFALNADQICGIKKLKDDVLFISDHGKYIYSYSIIAGGKVTVTSPLQNDIIDFVSEAVKSLEKHTQLDSTTRLLVKSLDEESDELLSFLSSWSALEIFVKKIFKNYEKSAFEKLIKGGNPKIAPKFLQRIGKVMKDKYGLTDKFSLISYELSPDSAESDIEKFEHTNAKRNKLMHGENVIISSLPTNDARYLLQKYLKLHIISKH